MAPSVRDLGLGVCRPGLMRMLLSLVFAINVVGHGSVGITEAFVDEIAEQLASSSRLQAITTDGWLQRWLSQLTILIPDITTTVSGLKIDIQDGKCTNFKVQDIKSTSEYGSVHIEAQGLGTTCSLHWSAHSTVFPSLGGSGDVRASVISSKLGGSLGIGDNGKIPPLPISIKAGDCQGVFEVTDLNFSGSISSKLLQILSPFIKRLVAHILDTSVCTQVDQALTGKGSQALQNFSSSVRTFLATNASTPTVPPDLPQPHKDFVDFGHNPGVVMIQQLLNVLNNPRSNHSINRIMRELLPHGAATLKFGKWLLPEKTIDIKGIGTIKISLNELTVGGLDTWRKLQLDTLNKYQMAFALGLNAFEGRAALRMEIAPSKGSPLQGGTLIESFNASLKLKNFSTGAALFAGVNQSRLGELVVNQLACAGCFAEATHSILMTDSSLSLPSINFSLHPTVDGTLEHSTDRMINLLAADVLTQFATTFDFVGRHAMKVQARDAVNTRINKVLAAPPSCKPPANLYASPILANICASTAVALTFLALSSSVFGAIWGKRRKQMVKPSASFISAMERGHSALSAMGRGQSADCGVLATQSDDIQQPVLLAPPTPSASPDGTQAAPDTVVNQAQVAQSLHHRLPDEQTCEAETGPLNTWDCLAFHARVWPGFRWSLPILSWAVIAAFMYSNASVSVTVNLGIIANGQKVAHFPPVFSFSLVSSIKEFMDSGVYFLGFLVIIFSGFWPYAKLLTMQFCWFAPTSVLSASRRLDLLDFLDTWGKWSLLDAFVMVLFMVAFKFDLRSDSSVFPGAGRFFEEAGASAQLEIIVASMFSFHTFVIATLGSLVLGTIMTACHRHALKLGEYSETAIAGNMSRLCNNLRPAGYYEGKFFVYGPIAAVSLALVLVVVGFFIDTFAFTFEGAAGYVLGDEGRVRSFSIYSLAMAIPGASPDPNSFGTRWLQVFFILFAGASVVAYYSILLCVWCAPLSPKKQTHFFVAAQVLNAWSGLDVFVFSILAGVLELRQLALFIVGDKCDGLDKVLKVLPIADQIPGEKTCFNVRNELKAGFWILLAAALLSTVVGRLMIARVKRALCVGPREAQH